MGVESAGAELFDEQGKLGHKRNSSLRRRPARSTAERRCFVLCPTRVETG